MSIDHLDDARRWDATTAYSTFAFAGLDWKMKRQVVALDVEQERVPTQHCRKGQAELVRHRGMGRIGRRLSLGVEATGHPGAVIVPPLLCEDGIHADAHGDGLCMRRQRIDPILSARSRSCQLRRLRGGRRDVCPRPRWEGHQLNEATRGGGGALLPPPHCHMGDVVDDDAETPCNRHRWATRSPKWRNRLHEVVGAVPLHKHRRRGVAQQRAEVVADQEDKGSPLAVAEREQGR